jgi:propionyl-CoA carboxylase alpha chain
MHGHAIELRVYAEDPFHNFLPSIGKITHYQRPTQEGIRLDDSYETGMEIPIYYDPMIAKLISYGRTRDEAINRMHQAIDEYKIEGVITTLPFGKFVMEHHAFRTGNFDTGFVNKYFTAEAREAQQKEEGGIAAMVAAQLFNKDHLHLKVVERRPTNWWINR